MKTKKTKVCVCAKCIIEDFCAAADWSLFNSDNKKCPNYKAGMKQYKQFLKEEIRDASIGFISLGVVSMKDWK